MLSIYIIIIAILPAQYLCILLSVISNININIIQVYNLISMLGEVLKKYETFKKSNQKSLQSQKQIIEQHLEAKTIQALKIQNHKVSKIHSNQQEIENRLKRNSQLQSQLKIHLGGWFMLYDQLNKTLKEAGDVVNYATYVQEEIRQINCQLQKKMEQDMAKSQGNAQQIKEQSNQTLPQNIGEIEQPKNQENRNEEPPN